MSSVLIYKQSIDYCIDIKGKVLNSDCSGTKAMLNLDTGINKMTYVLGTSFL